MSRPTACYVVGCHTPCDHAKVAATRSPEWGDIVAPPDVVEACKSPTGHPTCSRHSHWFPTSKVAA